MKKLTRKVTNCLMDATYEKKASIIIPTYNKLERLKLVLYSLEKQITDDIQVIIVFDGCKKEVVDEFATIILSFSPKIISYEKNAGRAAARNRGLAEAKGELILFLDDDRIVSEHYVDEHIKAHERINEPAVVLGERREIYFNEDEIASVDRDFSKIIAHCERKGEIQDYSMKKTEKNPLRWVNLYTGNVSVNKELIDRAGGFDEWFKKWGCEDNDLGIRLCLLGIKYYYCDIKNYHMLHESNFSNLKKESLYNQRHLFRKYLRYPVITCGIAVVYISVKIWGINVSEEQQKRYLECLRNYKIH